MYVFKLQIKNCNCAYYEALAGLECLMIGDDVNNSQSTSVITDNDVICLFNELRDEKSKRKMNEIRENWWVGGGGGEKTNFFSRLFIRIMTLN